MNDTDKSTRPRGFQFKQFFVAHDRCAQKVGTDSILLGSWCQIPEKCRRLLDIGSGSGLLALMMAQKSESHCWVDAVELDSNAAAQGRENFAASDWGNRLHMHQQDIAEFAEQPERRSSYDLIISNPPYFSPRPDLAHQDNARRQQAREQSGLTLKHLFTCAGRLLAQKGQLNLVLPIDTDITICARDNGLQLCRRAEVVTMLGQSPKLQLLCFVKGAVQGVSSETESIVVYQQQRQYSEQFHALCKDFYLNF